jgi:elongation factor Ts
MVNIDQLKQLRQETGISLAECRKALEEAKGNLEKAKVILKKWGQKIAGEKAEREAKEGIIETYLHPNKKVGVILDIRSESDFVAKSSEFQNLAHEICLQIAAMKPLFVNTEDIPEEFLVEERKKYLHQIKDSGKPKKVIEEIINGKLEKYKQEMVLFLQPWIRDETKVIKDLVDEYIAKVGENIVVKIFTRYEI